MHERPSQTTSQPSNDGSSERVAAFCRLDVVDASYRVCLRGSDPSTLEPVDVALEPDLAADLAAVLREHDFEQRAVACGLFGPSYAWRAVRIGATHHAVLLERNGLSHRVRRIAHRFALSSGDAELLRLTAGGYGAKYIAQHFGWDEEALNGRWSSLAQRLECSSLRELVELVNSRSAPSGMSDELLIRLGAAWQHPSSF